VPKYEFDYWTKLYASRTGALKSSAIRDLLSVTARSDIISLAGGLPYTKDFRMDKIVGAVKKTMNHQGSAALQYGPTEGHLGLKQHISKLMQKENLEIDPEDFIVTGGSQQGLDLLGKIFIDPGDIILVEAPSYVGALNAFAAYEPHIIGVPLDDNGLQVDLLEQVLNELVKAEKKAKFLYLVPNFHNPAGVTLIQARRRKLIELSEKYQLVIIEDNPYGQLRYEGKFIPPLRSMDEKVIYLGTFSKIFSPGLRLGWLVAPRPILEKIVFGKQAADLCSSSFTQMLLEEFFNVNELDSYLENLVKMYKSRRDAMLGALEEFFPKQTSWTKPKGGFFIWAKLPEYIDTTEMLAEAITHKVAYVPGRAFFADNSGKNYMRLAYCYPNEDEIVEGVRRLSLVIKDQIELYKSLAGHLKLE
jgi:2-aminoadipate transaminase